jgi:hypothetical protein
MNTAAPLSQFLPKPEASGFGVLCPFHDGAATLDLFLAELNPRDTALFDAALDLRSLAVDGKDPEACVAQLFRVRRLLGHRHYLAFYRVRCWARRALRIEVRAGRGSPWLAYELPLGCARIGEASNLALATVAAGDGIPETGQVRFVFAQAPAPAAPF